MPGCSAMNRPRLLAVIAIVIGSGISRAEAQPSLLRADSILLERTGCFGFCPQYQVRIAKSGEILVRTGGRVRLESGADSFQTSGPAQKRSVKPDEFLHLMTIAASLHFLELPDVIEDDIRFCAHRMTDHPSAIVTIFFGKQSKRVDDYLGCEWAPAGLRRLEAKIDSTAGTTTPLYGKANPVRPPTIWYNDLLVQAGVQGSVRFQVRLDSTGSPQLPTFAILAAPNPGFAVGIRQGLEHWRDPSTAGRTLEQTVRFVLLVDSNPPDSIARCKTTGSEWVVCRRRAPATRPVY